MEDKTNKEEINARCGKLVGEEQCLWEHTHGRLTTGPDAQSETGETEARQGKEGVRREHPGRGIIHAKTRR